MNASAMALLFVAGCAAAQEPNVIPQPPLVRWQQPAAAVIESRYQCGRQAVELVLEHDQDGVRVIRYVGGAGPATADELAKWNEWLKPVGRFFHHHFSCTGGSDEFILIRGATSRYGTERIVVPVQWGNGEIFLIPVAPGVNWE